LVIRDGEEKRIAGREVVRGDLLILAEGDRVAADAAVLSCNDLLADESLLTGESVSVGKTACGGGALEVFRPGGDDLPFVFSGTMIVRGRGLAQVHSTGPRTEMGKIGRSLETLESESSRLQKKSLGLIRSFAAVAFVVCATVVSLYGLVMRDWTSGLLSGIALAMSLIPEEIPVVITVFLALGALRMSQKRVLARRIAAIEALGSATVLCVDKTGTLTLNRMAVERIWAAGALCRLDGAAPPATLPREFHEAVRFAVLASETEPFDPMEKAFHGLGNRYLRAAAGAAHPVLVHEYALSPGLLAMSHVWRESGGDSHTVAAKGAPEAVFDLCRLDEERRRELDAEVERMAADGLRVLAVAKARFAGTDWPASQRGFRFELLGLMGLADPVRSGVPDAVAECHKAGVEVFMITGDYPSTARAVGRTIGLPRVEQALTGADIASMNPAQLNDALGRTSICARVLPEQKLSLVQAFKARGEIVAMTGDGVNDAPALKAAHIGIAMGGRGTDVAREAASLVLLDDDFPTIVEAIRSGRRIYDNIQKAFGFIFAIHVPIAGIVLVPLLFGWPVILSPVHIVFLELIIDPACTIAFEAEPPAGDAMRRPPRRPDEPLFSAGKIAASLLQGVIVLLTTLIALVFERRIGLSDAALRGATFTTLVIGLWSLILVNRAWSRPLAETLRTRNIPFWWVTAAALACLAVVLYAPALANIFHFAQPSPSGLLVSVAVGALGTVALAATRRLLRLRPQK
ncbi:MAG TPA: cation-translocating P-type ATPase, partial [Verrucomicrobiae bacterium]|nr:cation-translocating P-type ATPase [Verrucomicrobiae bacterium]